jgi:hypothetical protein
LSFKLSQAPRCSRKRQQRESLDIVSRAWPIFTGLVCVITHQGIGDGKEARLIEPLWDRANRRREVADEIISTPRSQLQKQL